MKCKGIVIIPIIVSLFCLFNRSTPLLAQEMNNQKHQKGSEVFINDLGKRAIQSLTQENESNISVTFLKLLDEGFDLDYICQFVLGRYWGSFNPQQQLEFKSIFREKLKNTYARRFKEYKNVQFIVKSSYSENGIEKVDSTLQKPGGTPITLQWEVAHGTFGYKIRDIVVEGLSMIQTLRSDYSSSFQRVGGLPEKFIDLLKTP